MNGAQVVVWTDDDDGEKKKETSWREHQSILYW